MVALGILDFGLSSSTFVDYRKSRAGWNRCGFFDWADRIRLNQSKACPREGGDLKSKI